MSENPIVSVVTIFLNAERFLDEAVESVFAQTYDRWELLLVDDGSRDASTAIARQFAERHPERVRCFEHAGHVNQGMSASRNLGISNARGKYIAFLDADDVWLPHKLEQQVTILDSQPQAAMVYGLSQWWYSWTGNQRDGKRDFVHHLGVPPDTLLEPPTLITRFFLAQDAAIPGPTDILIRREAIERVGAFEEVFRGAYEDEVFYAKVCLNEPVLAVNTCWDRYRQHPNSSNSVTEKSGQEYSTRLFFLNWLAGYLSDQRIQDPRVWQLLRKELWRCRHPALSGLLKRGRDVVLMKARRILPLPVRRWLFAKWKGFDYVAPPGSVRFGSLRRVTPLSREFGYDRGRPIDRYYIERFLGQHMTDIRGHVLEIADKIYTCEFGGDRVTHRDVLHRVNGNPNATIVGDLSCAEDIPSDSFDCVILTQTLQYIYDVPAAIRTVKRILRPGGVVLVTVPGISPISRYDMQHWGCFWAFTSLSLQRLFAETFSTSNIQIGAYGNVLTASAFLFGIACQELHETELDHSDPDYEVIVTARAVKST